jgi:hypothetical protein
MVSKPTGKPRGRPRGSKPPPMAGRYGRRPLPLAKDPRRWELAFIERATRVGSVLKIPELRIIDTFVTLQFLLKGKAKIVDFSDDNLESHRRGRPGFWIWMPNSKHLAALQNPHGSYWGNAFRPYIENMGKKLREYRKRSDDARRLQLMADIWELCLLGKRVDKARRLAASIREVEYFEEKMRPKYFSYAAPLSGRPN